ncbi:MAG: hypothetical protein R3232_10695, partial [Clostridia bacterium]|nr:hypothetical protein [Clostridia bacterium]
MIAYFYINRDDAETAAECGLKLSIHGEDILAERDHPMRAIRALLSPKDDMPKYNDESLACLKLDIPGDKLLVAEGMYLETGNRAWFEKSVMHAENYIFGTYRKPYYLLTFTVSSEYIGI